MCIMMVSAYVHASGVCVRTRGAGVTVSKCMHTCG